MPQATARVTVRIGGNILRSRPGASMAMGGVERSPLVTDDGAVMYTETVTPGAVRCTLVHTATTDLEAIRNSKNVTVSYEADTGKIYVLPNAFCSSVGELSGGEVEVAFAGEPVQEI